MIHHNTIQAQLSMIFNKLYMQFHAYQQAISKKQVITVYVIQQKNLYSMSSLIASQDNHRISQLLSSQSYKLIDFQWRFAVTSQHSLVVQNKQCLIQLKLQVIHESNQKIQHLHIELTLAQFNEFYREMEKVSNMLSFMS